MNEIGRLRRVRVAVQVRGIVVRSERPGMEKTGTIYANSEGVICSAD